MEETQAPSGVVETAAVEAVAEGAGVAGAPVASAGQVRRRDEGEGLLEQRWRKRRGVFGIGGCWMPSTSYGVEWGSLGSEVSKKLNGA